MRTITVKAPVNIAVIKYWGKLDEKLIIPINSSISGTLSIDDLYAQTSISVSEKYDSDRMWLNGKEESIEKNSRLVGCLAEIRKRSKREDIKNHIHICSRNNFPTAAGLASSAAGYSCLVYALGHLFGIEDKRELSILARMGSGSAVRSIFGGFVQWIAGTSSDTSVSEQIVDHKYWPEMRVIIMVVNDKKKETGSTTGMQNSVHTSTLITTRATKVVPQRMVAMTDAIKKRDYQSFAEITMRDSNQFHAIALDTWPPIKYMSDLSFEIVRLVHSVNDYYGTHKLAYTFDAGPNACIYLLDDQVPLMFALINKYFPSDNPEEFVRGRVVPENFPLPEELLKYLSARGNVENRNSLKYIINTSIGGGPEIVEENLMGSDGLPL